MHPFVKILCFIVLLILSHVLNNPMIFLLCIFLIALALKLDFNKFLRVVKRMRWLFLSIFVIYVFGTPGEYIQYFPNDYAPTFEGCHIGALQIAKLLIALASLSIIFATSSKEDLMLGLYILLSPLQLLGLNVRRFSARLLLTLDYVEELVAKENFKFSLSRLNDWQAENSQAQNSQSQTACLPERKVIIMQFPAFSFIDKCLMAMMTVGLLVAVAWMVFL